MKELLFLLSTVARWRRHCYLVAVDNIDNSSFMFYSVQVFKNINLFGCGKCCLVSIWVHNTYYKLLKFLL